MRFQEIQIADRVAVKIKNHKYPNTQGIVKAAERLSTIHLPQT